MVAALLKSFPPVALLGDVRFRDLKITREEIDVALGRKEKTSRWYKKRPSVVDPEGTLERIRKLTLLDDELMRDVLRDNIPGVQDIVRVVLKRDDIEVVAVETQVDYHNLFGRSVRLDVMAKDSRKKLYNVEIQRDSDKAPPERARIHVAAVDWNNLDRGS